MERTPPPVAPPQGAGERSIFTGTNLLGTGVAFMMFMLGMITGEITTESILWYSQERRLTEELESLRAELRDCEQGANRPRE